MPAAVSFWGQTYNDNTRKGNGEPESSSFRIAVQDLTAANVAATQTALATLASAIDAVVIGQLASERLTFEDTFVSANIAASQLAQRENKLLLRYHSTTVPPVKYQVSLPTFDLTTLPSGSEFLDLTAGVGLALKTAFEAVARAPGDSAETVILDSAQFVGRNS